MVNLRDIRRPPMSLVKIVEAIGILLRIPKSNSKSKYKAPCPTNYDATVELLCTDFYGTMNQLTFLQSSGIPNDIATELYAKTQEPSFDYESAVSAGGLATRELFNTLMLILDHLKGDTFRIPVKITNILVVVDGTRSSYIALDAATHVHNHGVCNVAALTPNDAIASKRELINSHLCNDLTRRCREQYKIQEHCYKVDPLTSSNTEELIAEVKKILEERDCKVLVVGVDRISSCGCTEFMQKFVEWAAWESSKTAVLAKSFSRVRQFPLSHVPRKYQVCAKDLADLQPVFSGTLELMRPGDSVVIVSMVKSADPVGDAQETRFGMGERYNWVNGEDLPTDGPIRPGWNDKDVERLNAAMVDLLAKSQTPGSIVLERIQHIKTVGQELVRIALSENVDFLVLRRGSRSHVSAECLREAKCTVVLTT